MVRSEGNIKAKYKFREGFTLVEVIIAVVILAILAVPILVYFTNASTSASNGKNTQKANVAAQSAIEDIQACDTFEQIENDLTTIADPWMIATTKDAEGKTQTAKLEKDMTVDGFVYHVEANLNYVDYTGVTSTTTNTIVSKYNSYDKPDPEKVYSENNIVCIERDQEDAAVSEFLLDNASDTSKTDSVIRNALQRDIIIKIQKDTDNYRVSCEYEYTYAGTLGSTKTYTEEVASQKISADKLQNIFLFYELSTNELKTASSSTVTSNIKIKIADEFWAETGTNKPIKINMVVQDEPALYSSVAMLPNSGETLWDQYLSGGSCKYKQAFDLTGVSATMLNKDNLNIKTNCEPRYTSVDAVSLRGELVSKSKVNRIANVNVKVYNKEDLTNPIVDLDTSKGE